MEAEGLLPQLESFMQTLEGELGWRAPEGYTEGLKFVQHLWDPLQHMYRCVRASGWVMVAQDALSRMSRRVAPGC
jgi:hypothetical protein